jgi:hypothetical protein
MGLIDSASASLALEPTAASPSVYDGGDRNSVRELRWTIVAKAASEE